MKLLKLAAVPAIALAVGLGLAACGDQAAHNSAPVATHSASAPAKPAATHSAVAKPAVPGIGQPVRAGVYTFTVTKVACGLTQLGQPGNTSDGNGPGGLSVPLHGQFCVALVNEQNVSKSPQPVPFSATLTGTNGSSNDNDVDPVVLTNAELQFIPGFSTPAGTVNPGTTNPDVFVWDIPASVHPATVTIDSGFFGDPSGTVNVR